MADDEKDKGQKPPETSADNSEPSPELTRKATEASVNQEIDQVKNIERIIDINLELRVKIGDLTMKLRDVLDLYPGSILEIDKNADAPLDLTVGEKKLAKGEVVTVGESLGLRILKK